METNTQNSIWKLLWEYDPNGLVAVDLNFEVVLVNPAFCQMFGIEAEAVLGQPASSILGNTDSFKRVKDTQTVLRGIEREYSSRQLFVEEVVFPIPEESIIACIMVDRSQDYKRKKELQHLKTETVLKVREVVDNQMKVAQEIAGLLGETTAETKVSLLKIVEAVEEERV